MSYSRIVAAFCGGSWAIREPKLNAIVELIELRASGGRLSGDEIAARVGEKRKASSASGGGVAVIPITGVIAPRADMMTETSGMTTAEQIGAWTDQAMSDDSVSRIVFDVDSPGGMVAGIPELSDKIYSYRGRKPMTAVASGSDGAASAAYWLATAADELVVSPSAEVGSVGVLAVHEDRSAALGRQGIKLTIITAGKYKAEGNPWGPLDKEAREYVQSRVDADYERFTAALGRNRGLPQATIKSKFGEGRMVDADSAVALGMADRIGTLQDEIRRALSASGVQEFSSRRAILDLTPAPVVF